MQSTPSSSLQIGTIRTQHSDNSALRARLSDAVVEDRPVLDDLRASMAEPTEVIDVSDDRRSRRKRGRR
jgi:hypothetical protein